MRLGIRGEQVVVPDAALQRQPAGRPLILPVERRRQEVADDLGGAWIFDGLREPVRHAEVRPDGDDLVEVVVFLARIAEPALIAELHVVRAGDVRDRRPVVRQRPDQMMIEAAADAGGHPGDQARDLAALFRQPDHPGVVRAVDPRRRVAVPGLVGPPAGLQQDPARDRRRPGGLLDVGRLEEAPAARFRRRRRGAAPFVLLGPCTAQTSGD